ncbi:GntR family transcriptional regulator [Streptomonospora litoralis]|uniref:Putative HTH-type transcriptional regulator YurK n=1 Tax=Streptomonospora litoralis TaxID=2498135 RepID=A0A4P6PY04_9ACTN|nr:GntR family transcriptional regulator [Streptomonospora litoralis]QBI53156.1 putative HTH-type transcriptional regulator YurK [Streptomonospora litoralis]
MDYDPTRPKWQQIAEVLRERIDSGTYPPHHKFSEVQLESEFDVARVTVRKAIKALREEGRVVTSHGMGSFVADTDSRK